MLAARCRRLYRKQSRDDVSGSAAALSYYLLFSLFPFLLFVAALCAFLPLEAPVQQLLDRLRPMVPGQAMELIDTHLRGLVSRERPHLVTLGLLGSFWSASRGVEVLRRALNRAFDVEESRSAWRTEMVSWSVTVAGAMLTVAAAVAVIAGGGLGLLIARRLGIQPAVLSVMRWLRWPVLGIIFLAAVGVAYRVLPDVRLRLRSIAPGALIGALAWGLATWALGQYVAAFGQYDVTYGSLGGVMVLLTWLYLSGFIAVAGGQFNAALVGARPGNGMGLANTQIHEDAEPSRSGPRSSGEEEAAASTLAAAAGCRRGGADVVHGRRVRRGAAGRPSPG
jgi:membrane protein